MSSPIVVFDFDGVVCDSTDECMVTSWNAWERWNGRAGVRTGLGEFDREARDAFRRVRPYVRGAGEYYVVRRCMADGVPIGGQADLERYGRDWQEHLEPFKRVFYEERARMRAGDLAAWIGLHPVWPQVVEALSRLNREGRAYVATLKDAESVRLILGAAGVALAADRLLDESRIRSKLEALQLIGGLERLQAQHIVFLDDNPTHLREPFRAGFACYMTGWGVRPPEFIAMAEREGIPVISLAQLATIGGETAGRPPRSALDPAATEPS